MLIKPVHPELFRADEEGWIGTYLDCKKGRVTEDYVFLVRWHGCDETQDAWVARWLLLNQWGALYEGINNAITDWYRGEWEPGM